MAPQGGKIAEHASQFTKRFWIRTNWRHERLKAMCRAQALEICQSLIEPLTQPLSEMWPGAICSEERVLGFLRALCSPPKLILPDPL
jgi:hypothetical protein